MSNTLPSRVGLVEGNSDNNELFLKKFSGEILQTFEESNVFKALHTIRTIESGKSAQFPVTGIATAAYHTPGESLASNGVHPTAGAYLSDIKKTEKIITIDKMLVASTFLANIDDVKNHYDIRSVYANELGKALAVRFDTALAKVFIAAARDTSNLSQVSGITGSSDEYFSDSCVETDGKSFTQLVSVNAADVVVVLYVVDVSQESRSNQHLIDGDDSFSLSDIADVAITVVGNVFTRSVVVSGSNTSYWELSGFTVFNGSDCV